MLWKLNCSSTCILHACSCLLTKQGVIGGTLCVNLVMPLRGRHCVVKKLLVRGERVSAITAITLNGILDYRFLRGTTNGDIFLDFIEQNLLPHAFNAF